MNTPFPGYQVPHDTLTQVLDTVGTPNVNRMNPVLIGTQYLLSVNDGRPLAGDTFSTSTVNATYRTATATSTTAVDTNNNTVDLASVQLIADQLEAVVSGSLALNSAGTSGSDFRVRLSANSFYTTTGSGLASALNSRPVAPGDVLKVTATSGGAVAYCKVIDYLPTPLTAAVGSVVKTGAMGTATVTTSGTYLGTTDTSFVVRILSNDAALLPVAPPLAGITYTNVTQAQLTSIIAYTTAVNAALAANGVTHTAFETTPTTCTVVPGVSGIDTGRWTTLSASVTAAAALKIVTATVYDTVGLHTTRTIKWASDADKVLLLEDQPSSLTGLLMNIVETTNASTVGNIYTVTVSGSGVSSTLFNGLVLDTPAYPFGNTGALTAVVVSRFSGPLTAANTQSGIGPVATPTATYVAYTGSSLGVSTGGAFYNFTDGRGTVRVAFRAAVKTSATEAPILVSPGDDLSRFGEYHDDNDIGYGVRAMQTGAGSVSFYVLRTDGDNTTALAAGLQKLRSSDLFYTLALLTNRTDTAQMLRDDITAASAPTSMKWRKGYVGYDSPASYVLWGNLAATGTARTATLVNEQLTVSTGVSRNEGDFVSANVRPGDLVRFSGQTTDFTVASIVAGVNGTSWQLMVTGASADITTPTAFTITKPNSADNVADFIITTAGQIGNPSNGTASDGRMTLLWGDNLQSAMVDTGTLPNKYLAAWAAGLRCSLFPQQGIATYQVPIVLSAPSMHTKFTPDVLNRMSACGVTVVTQDTSDTPVYILDQVTTCTTGGLLKFQDSLHHIVDAFSYAIKDGQVGLKGRKNATRVTASAVANISLRTAIDFCQVPLSEFKVAGPRVIAFYNEDGVENQVTVKRSANLVNRLATYIQIDVPVPLNGIDNVVRASVGTTF